MKDVDAIVMKMRVGIVLALRSFKSRRSRGNNHQAGTFDEFCAPSTE